MAKKKKYEVTSIGVRDDKVVNKGKMMVGIGAVIAVIGAATIASGRQWFTPDEYNTQFGLPCRDEEDNE